MASVDPLNRGNSGKFQEQHSVSPLGSRFKYVGPYILERLLSRTPDAETGVTAQVFYFKYFGMLTSSHSQCCIYYCGEWLFV